MKNKILLTVVFASLGFAIYALFSNLNKTNYQTYYYEGTNVMTPTQRNNINWRSTSSVDKKKQYEKKSASTASRRGNSFSKDASFKTKMMTDDVVPLETSVSELSLYHPNFQYSSRKKQEEIRVNYDVGTTGVLLTQSRSSKKSNNQELNNLAVNSAYSSSAYSTYSSNIQSSYKAPVDPNNPDGDIIIDPGGDPDPDTIIPVGDGGYIFTILIFAYIFFVAYKRKWARSVNS